MKNQYLPLLFILISILFSLVQTINPNGKNLDRVEISGVSIDNLTWNITPTGSVNGGTLLHLKAKGHSLTPSKNKIFIGPYPCRVNTNEISETRISCFTTAQTEPDRYKELPIELHVENKVQSICKTPTRRCLFTYSRDSTPLLKWIIPSTATPETQINWKAFWRIQKSQQVTKMVIGDENCHRYQLQNPQNRQEIPDDLNLSIDQRVRSKILDSTIQCQTSSEQTAGLYDVSSETLNGNFYKYASSSQITADGKKKYDFAVTANIKYISSNEGSLYGNRLQIKGQGFGRDKEKVTVKVGDQDCTVSELTNRNIICELAAGAQPAESSGQFIHGQGLQQTEYDLKASPDGTYEEIRIENSQQLKSAIEDGSIGTDRIKKKKILGSWETEFSDYTGIHMKGYFKAPRTGTYKFWVSASGSSEIYLNTNEMTPSIADSDKIVSRDDVSYQRNYYEPNGFTWIQENGQELEAGKLYWMEGFMVKEHGSGYITVSVEAPGLEDGSYAANSISEIQYFRIIPNKDNERWRFKVFNKEKYNLFTEKSIAGSAFIQGFLGQKNDGIAWNSLNSSQFIEEIGSIFGDNPVLVEAHDLDAMGNRCTDCTAAGMEIVFEFQDYRNPRNTLPFQCFQCTISKEQAQSSPISGSFTAQLTWESKGQERTEFLQIQNGFLGGKVKDIPFDADAKLLQEGLVRLDQRFGSVQVRYKYSAVDGRQYEFDFISDDVSLKGDIQNFVVNVSNISGGKGKGTHSVEQGKIRRGSKNTFYEPVPFDMSYVVADRPNVLVIVNDVLSQCSGDCTYQTTADKTPELTSFSKREKNLSLGITLPLGLGLTVSDLEIKFGGYDCDASAGGSDIAAFSCSVEGIEAGDHLPVIFAEGVGYVKPSGSLSAINQGIQIDSLSPSSGSINGGKQVTISGSGFAKAENIENLVVKFGNVVAHVVSSTDTQIVVDIPSSQTGTGDVDVRVEYNGKTSPSQPFTYNDLNVPTITSIEIDSIITNYNQKVEVNPVKKQGIKVIGTNFENGKTTIWLLNKETDKVVYDVNVNSVNPSGTEIIATLSGGKVGEYNLIVKHEDYGNSVQKIEFDYIIKITNIDLTEGPKQGGPKITITGVNFGAQAVDNQVFFEQNDGYINSQAIIESCSTTEIVARIPKMPIYGNINEPFTITVFGRIIEQGTCKDTTNNCQFTYLNGIQVPYLTEAENKEVSNGDHIQLQGEFLPIIDSSDSAQLIIEGISSNIPLTFSTINQFSAFQVPNNLKAGKYLTQVKLESYGVIGAFFLDVKLEIGKIDPSELNIGGGEITISGSGFSETSKFYIDEKECIVKTFSNTEIVCIAPAHTEEGPQIVKVSENYRDSDYCTQCFSYINMDNMVVQQTVPSSNAAQIQVPSGIFTFQATLAEQFRENINFFFQSKENKKMRIQADNVVKNSNTITATFNEIIAGNYDVQIEIEEKGFATFDFCQEEGFVGPAGQIEFSLQPFVIQNGQQTGLSGGTDLVLSGKGLNTQQAYMNEITVCGQLCEIEIEIEESGATVTSSQISCKLPKVNTMFLLGEDYQGSQSKEERLGKFFQKVTTSETGFVNVISDIVEGSVVEEGEECASSLFTIEFEGQQNSKVFIERIVLDPGVDYDMENYFGKVKLQGRNAVDDAWVDLDVYSSDHVSEFQEVSLKVEDTSVGAEENRKAFIQGNVYRYFRVVEEQLQQNKALGKLFVKRVEGISFYEQDVEGDEDFECGVVVRVNGQMTGIQGDGTVQYRGSVATARVTDISPQFSTRIGSDQITISGSNFGTDSSAINVFVDGQECTVTAVINEEIKFTTPASIVPVAGAKPIEVTLNDVPVLMKKGVVFYSRALRWSHVDTWGGESLPRDKHFAVVPKGETLVVDMSTPILNTLLVEGTVLFDSSLNLDIEVKAEYIIVRGGQFIAGTETKPYTGKLTITLYGNYWGKQLPDYGNKAFICHFCQIDIHARKKVPHFALLKDTVNPGDSTIKLSREVDWQIDDFIGISTTDFNGEHSEKLKITSITSTPGSNESTIEFTPKLNFTHIAEEEDFGSRTLKNYAEVILLSSNIKIRGDPEDSQRDQYGAHLVVHGKSSDGSIARIDGVEFFNTGQARILGRYALRLHMLGDSPNSYVKNTKIHSSFSRAITIQSSSYLKIQNNVAFNVPGHNILLEYGSETNNIIEGNVLISPRSAFTLLQTDIVVSGIWITNPSNIVRYNIVAGSQFYGIKYEINENPISRQDLCPEGMPILELQHNIGHSNQRYGLRFFRLYPKSSPCNPEKENHPSFSRSTFRNQTSWKNGESGILAEFMGNSIFEDCIMADNFRTGFQSHIANITSEPILLRNSLIIGKSTINGEAQEYNQSAIIVPRTEGLKVDNVDIYNMPENSDIIVSSSENHNPSLWTTGGYQNDFKRINIQNSNSAKKLIWKGPRTNLIFDEDGSLTGKNVPTWITPYNTHFDKPIAEGLCERNEELYDDSVLCSIPLRAIKFGNMVPPDEFLGSTLNIFNVNDETKEYDVVNSDLKNFGQYVQYKIMNKQKDLKGGFAAVLPVDYVFNVHWSKGIEWDHFLLYPSYKLEEEDKNIILRFPYWSQRELFEIERMVAENLIKKYKQSFDLSKFIDSVTKKPYDGDDKCSLGEWYQDTNEKFFYLCISGKGRDGIKQQQIDINAVFCKDSCEREDFECNQERTFRVFQPFDDFWAQMTYLDRNLGAQAMAKRPGSKEWEYRVPQEGDDVRIPCEFMMILNVPSFRFNNLYIDGLLRIDPGLPKTTIYARNIWIRGGKLVAGVEEYPYDQELEIVLEGDRFGESLVIDQLSSTGTKSLAVTGRLELYGITPNTTQTRLTAIVNPGDTQIQVKDDISDWKIGDKLVLGANRRNGTGFETVEIQSKDDDSKTITLTDAVQYWHYGHPFITVGRTDESETKIDGIYGGDLDMRGTVGHITRNIKIRGNYEDSEWGGSLINLSLLTYIRKIRNQY